MNFSGRIVRGSGGFTLLEMLVSITIFTLLTSTLLVKNSQFKGNVAITNLAYQMALSLREAQSYGVNVKGVATAGGSPFSYTTPYGIHFDTTNTYLLFGDSHPAATGNAKSGNRVYTASDRLIRSYPLQVGNTIARFCVTRSSPAATTCSGVGGLTSLDVTFVRPQPDAVIREGAASGYAQTSADSAAIYVKNDKGVCKGVSVTNVGQIGVIDSPTAAECP